MPLHSIRLGPDGPQTEVGLSVPIAYSRWGGPPGTWRALIDTGSDMTAISPGVVVALHPMRIGTQPVARPGGGAVACDTYDVRLRIGGHATAGRWFELEAVEAQPATPDIDVLVGMDLLLRIDMIWRGSLRRLVLMY